MGLGFKDLAGHHAWATQQLLDFCQGLDATELDATVPGTYGTIIETLRHIVDSEMSYVFRLTGAWTERPWQAGEPAGLTVLAERAAELARVLEAFLASDWDDERLGEARGPHGEYSVPAGVFLTQAIHHANEHRAHVCTIIGALGREAPDVSAWGYALATGRMTPITLVPQK